MPFKGQDQRARLKTSCTNCPTWQRRVNARRAVKLRHFRSDLHASQCRQPLLTTIVYASRINPCSFTYSNLSRFNLNNIFNSQNTNHDHGFQDLAIVSGAEQAWLEKSPILTKNYCRICKKGIRLIFIYLIIGVQQPRLQCWTSTKFRSTLWRIVGHLLTAFCSRSCLKQIPASL